MATSCARSLTRVTLLTDFGTRDGFVGAVKGVLADLAPGILCEDIAHDLPRGDVLAAARALARYWRRYPPGTVHLVVVDPGVGSARRALACAADGRLLVGPDNGVLTPALVGAADARCVHLDRRALAPVSATFHGRDVFAPVAAALASGRALAELGDAVDDPVVLPRPAPERDGQDGRGEVIGVDRFGNVTTNLPGSWAADGAVIEVAGRRLPLRRSYGGVPSGEPLALVDSEGWIEVAVRDGSAAEQLAIVEGALVLLKPT